MKANVLWKNEIIGELTYDTYYTFKYTRKDYCIGEFKDLDRTYVSKELFITFSLRLPNRRRKDYQKFLAENNLQNSSDLEVLLFTKGKLPTDFLSIEECTDGYTYVEK